MLESLTDTVPLIVDDIKNYQDFNMTRCSYFSIEVEETLPNITLTINNLTTIPFLLMGLQGIIITVDQQGRRFSNADIIDKHFDSIEELGLDIDIETLWLPNFKFNGYNHQIENVYRISGKLFSAAYQYSNSTLSKEEFIRLCEQMEDIIFSEDETIAFKVWAENQVNDSKANFENNQSRALRYDDRKGLSL